MGWDGSLGLVEYRAPYGANKEGDKIFPVFSPENKINDVCRSKKCKHFEQVPPTSFWGDTGCWDLSKIMTVHVGFTDGMEGGCFGRGFVGQT